MVTYENEYFDDTYNEVHTWGDSDASVCYPEIQDCMNGLEQVND